jgi:hypothetical protein
MNHWPVNHDIYNIPGTQTTIRSQNKYNKHIIIDSVIRDVLRRIELLGISLLQRLGEVGGLVLFAL